MAKHDQLLHDILANPKDNLYRAVYADWLIDHEEPLRGEFIHNQLLHPRELLKAVAGQYLKVHLPGYEGLQEVLWVPPPCSRREGGFMDRLYVSRGFPYKVATTMAGWFADGPNYVSLYPITEVHINLLYSDLGTREFWVKWCSRSLGVRRRDLPRGFWNLLDRGRLLQSGSNGYYFSTQASSELFNRACLAWARRRAVVLGLVPEGVFKKNQNR